MKPAELRWNGWGSLERERPLTAPERRWLGETLEVDAFPVTPAPDLEAMEIPPSSLATEALASLVEAIDGPVTTDRRDRAYHALGQSYHDLLRYRSGVLDTAPDAVAYPTSEADVSALLSWAAERDVAVVPFGGGSSVVGGVTAAGAARVITMDMTRMRRLLSVDPENRLATLEAGIDGPSLEATLGDRGYTLGHFPQSFEYSTLGGWIAARGAGQQSNRYGAANHWLASARLVTPTGTWETEPYPASAAGPRLADLVVGSEGTLGVITSATVHIHPAPEQRWEHGFLFRDLESGMAAVHAISQAEVGCSMLRLSDSDETRFQSAFASLGHTRRPVERAFRRWLAWRGYTERPTVLLAGIEGDRKRVDRDASTLRRIARRHGAQPLGAAPGRRWRETRFDAPFLRDPLLDIGLGVDTLETATRWANLRTLYAATREAIVDALGPDGVVMAHVSHTYTDGASLYFTMVFIRDPVDPIDQWRRLKAAASDAIVANGGTITHHHGVGEDHRAWLAQEKDAIAIAALDAARGALDPHGHMNPGKLIP